MKTDEPRISNGPQATLIISVYKNLDNLRCILESLKYQSRNDFEVIVSEDGQDPEVASLIQILRADLGYNLYHLNHPDLGFRKNKALNSAIRRSISDLLIFIDGDCVPHPRFVESHIKEARKYLVCTGRRVELGRKSSQLLIKSPSSVKTFANRLLYSMALPFLVIDGVKNPESGYFSRALHGLAKHRFLSVVGCNFSCSKQALIDINGFNEDYEAPGIGEDSDVEWRFIRAGYEIKNIKFLAPLFHLWHERSYSLSKRNKEIYDETRVKDQWFASRGLSLTDLDCVVEKNTAR